jgi:hypothetical protein
MIGRCNTMLAGIQGLRACRRYCFRFDGGTLYFLSLKQVILEQPHRWAVSEQGAPVRFDIEPARAGVESYFDGVALLSESRDDAASGV